MINLGNGKKRRLIIKRIHRLAKINQIVVKLNQRDAYQRAISTAITFANYEEMSRFMAKALNNIARRYIKGLRVAIKELERTNRQNG